MWLPRGLPAPPPQKGACPAGFGAAQTREGRVQPDRLQHVFAPRGSELMCRCGRTQDTGRGTGARAMGMGEGRERGSRGHRGREELTAGWQPRTDRPGLAAPRSQVTLPGPPTAQSHAGFPESSASRPRVCRSCPGHLALGLPPTQGQSLWTTDGGQGGSWTMGC